MANRFNFRFFLKEDKKIYEVISIVKDYKNKTNDNIKVFIYKPTENKDLQECLNVNDGVLLQSTGLVDKKGKEVFEGDIIKDGNIMSYIVYYEDEAKFIIKYKNDFLCIEDCNVGYMTTYEIIGNIYENEELLN